MASGNIPDINSVQDAFGYVANSALNALDVAGAGKLAKAGLKGLGKLGLNWASEAVHATGEWVISDITSNVVSDGLNLTIDYKRTWVVKAGIGPIGFGSASRGLGVAMHEHHSYPKYLGGDPKQLTTKMPADQHKQLHKDMNDYMYNQRNADGYHMRPQRGNSGERILENFDKTQIDKALKGFYKGPGAKYKSAAKDFFKQIKGLR